MPNESSQDQSQELELYRDEDESDEDSADEIEPELEALFGLAQMDAEAAMAYQIVAELVLDSTLRFKLLEFAADHQRHANDIGKYLRSQALEVAGVAPDPASSTFATLAGAMVEIGALAGVRALQSNELFTNASYRAALEFAMDEEAQALIARNLADEERHARWLTDHQDADWEGTGEADSASAPA